MALAPSRYELLDRIAVGGMAEVFRAKAYGAHGFEKTLAIKKILPELAKDPEFEDRFIAEAKLAVELSHANIVQVLDFGRLSGTLFIAMELVNGLDLAALLKFYRDSGERVAIPAAFQISIELVRGLSFAHQSGVVHRDISPSNILLSKAGEVKIADFGIAMALREDLAADEGRIMGKWRYMSPEQTRGKRLDESSDLFSASAVIYELFAGAKLFQGSESEEIIESIHCMPIPRLSELRPGVPEALDEILAMALERDAEKRSLSGADMLRSLTEASYKSSIVATSIDVADAVAAAEEAGVIGPSVKPPAGIDALIRAQLQEASEDQRAGVVERRTAVAEAGEESKGAEGPAGDEGLAAAAQLAGGTMVRGVVDGDGVTNWRLDRETVAAVPSAKRTANNEVIAEDETAKNTESGGGGRYQQDEGASPGLRRGVILAAIAFTVFTLMVIVFALREPTLPHQKQARAAIPGSLSVAPSALAPVVNPVVTPARGERELLILDTMPPGAKVFIDGHVLEAVSPTEVRVPVGVEVAIRLQLDGYEEYRGTRILKAGRALELRQTMVPYKSTLIVTTTPRGATVALDGKDLGRTPLSVTTLPPGTARTLVITLKNYQRVDRQINLLRDQPTSIRETLISTIVYGKINIDTSKHWATVRDGSRVIGETPGTFRLSVGKHKLSFSNPPTGKSMIRQVEVFEGRVKTYRFDW